MNWLKNKKTVAVHAGNFHPDDVFCIAALNILYKGKIKVLRTREEKVYTKADLAVDIGFESDPARDRFDHHQAGGAGSRANKIPYSSFGLLWQKYGAEICGAPAVADYLDRRLVQVIDADDNGCNIYQPLIAGVSPLTLTDLIYALKPTWAESDLDIDKFFFRAVALAREILLREIKVATDKLAINRIIMDYYKKSSDKRLIVIDTPKVSRYEIWDALQAVPEPLFIVYGSHNDWSAVAMRLGVDDVGSRKYFPLAWAGLRDEALVKITGVAEAQFCHNGRFLVGTKTKESAIKLAELALQTL